MKPKIIMHTQISLDGRIKGFDNPEVYYQVAGGIHSDAGAVWVQYCFYCI